MNLDRGHLPVFLEFVEQPVLEAGVYTARNKPKEGKVTLWHPKGFFSLKLLSAPCAVLSIINVARTPKDSPKLPAGPHQAPTPPSPLPSRSNPCPCLTVWVAPAFWLGGRGPGKPPHPSEKEGSLKYFCWSKKRLSYLAALPRPSPR